MENRKRCDRSGGSLSKFTYTRRVSRVAAHHSFKWILLRSAFSLVCFFSSFVVRSTCPVRQRAVFLSSSIAWVVSSLYGTRAVGLIYGLVYRGWAGDINLGL